MQTMDGYRTLCLMLQLAFLFSNLLLNDCRKLEGYKFPVYTTEFCPRNKTEWDARSNVFNCSSESSYACFPNENITELLEFCYPLQIINIQHGLCLFLRKEKSKLDYFDCNQFRYGCPTNNHFGSEIYKYPSCILIGDGCFLAEPSCESSTSYTEQRGPQANNDNKLVWIFITVIGVFILVVALIGIFFYIHRRKKLQSPKGEKTKNDGESPGEEETTLLQDTENYRETYLEEEIGKAIFHQWEKDDEYFVSTKAAEEVDNMIKNNKIVIEKYHSGSEQKKIINDIVIVKGHSGSGKSAIVQHIALKYREQGWVVKPVYSVEEIHDAYKSGNFIKDKTIFVCNDPIGTESFDEIRYNSWNHYKESLKSLIEHVKIVLTCRTSVLQNPKAKRFLQGIQQTVNINDGHLRLSKLEKKCMLEKYIGTEQFKENDVDIIHKVDMYFPLLCKLSKTTQTGNKLNVFYEPIEVLRKVIEDYRNHAKKKYCALLCLFLFNKNICLRDLEENSELFERCLQLSELSPLIVSPLILMKQFEYLEGFFVKKIVNSYSFCHDLIMEVTTYVLGTEHPEETIKYADLSFLQNRITFQKDNDIESKEHTHRFIIPINDDHIRDLVNRLYEELFGNRFIEVVLNPFLKKEKVISGIITKLKEDKEKMKMIVKTKTKNTENDDYLLINFLETSYSRLNFVRSRTGLSPLLALIIFRHNDLSCFCLNEIMKSKQRFKSAVLFTAICCNGNRTLFQMFMEDGNREYAKEVWDGMYPIHVASLFHNFELLDDLITNKDDVNLFTTGVFGSYTPLYLATANGTSETEEPSNDSTAEFGHSETVKRLIDLGANVNLCTTDGHSPLDVACRKGFIFAAYPLLKAGAEVNLCGKYGDTPLIAACGGGHDNTVKLLLNNGAKVNLCDEFGQRPIGVACRYGYIKIVQLLLSYGAEVNFGVEYGLSPLGAACRCGYDDIVTLLLDNGADVNLSDPRGNSPLKAACMGGYAGIVKLLLNSGAQVNPCGGRGNSPLGEACKFGYDNIVHILITYGAKVNLCDENKISPLLAACTGCHYNIVQLLLKKGAILNLCDDEGNTPLCAACRCGYDNIVELLLNKGAKVNLCDENKHSPLVAACRYGHDNIVKLLLNKGAKVNVRDKNGNSPLLAACKDCHYNIVQRLLNKNAEVNLCNKYGLSPLGAACKFGYHNIVQLLLINGAEVNRCDANQKSPLRAACRYGYDGIVNILLKTGAEVNLCDNMGVTPLYIACKHVHEGTVELLLNNGAKVNFRDKDGNSPLRAACEGGHNNIVQLLLNNGAEVNLSDAVGKSPLGAACKNGYDNIIIFLLNNGAEVNLFDKMGVTPLYIACKHVHKRTAELLLNRGAEVNLCDKDGKSPLTEACRCGYDGIVQLLLNKGADVNLYDKTHYNPLRAACEGGHENIVQLLLNKGAKVNLCDEYGLSHLGAACKYGYDNIVKLLLNNGAEVNSCDKNGNTPLSAACIQGRDSTVQVLLNNGANVNLCNHDGVSPLVQAYRYRHKNIVQLLLSNEADVNLCAKGSSKEDELTKSVSSL